MTQKCPRFGIIIDSMSLSKQQYKQFYDTVGSEIGWDFSKLKVTTEGEDWELYAEVQKISKRSDLLLDIGTGGGEMSSPRYNTHRHKVE
jgi:hypothetical protein